MVGIICNSDERRQQRNDTLREYGVDPNRATAQQREMADCVAQKTNEAYREAGRLGGRR